jgi:hypothetical protein
MVAVFAVAFSIGAYYLTPADPPTNRRLDAISACRELSGYQFVRSTVDERPIAHYDVSQADDGTWDVVVYVYDRNNVRPPVPTYECHGLYRSPDGEWVLR